jgi:hypothetical protein
MNRLARALLSAACLLALSKAEPVPTAGTADRFRVVDVFVDTQAQPLAAYQVELTGTAGTVRIVGIEGGDPEVFRDPPHYDPRAMQSERVILAAFTTAPEAGLPVGRSRVASVHLQVVGDAEPSLTVRLHVAASATGTRIPAQATIIPPTERTAR